MNKIFLLIVSVLLSSQAFAKVVSFNCLTQQGFEDGAQRTITFTLNMTDLKRVLLVGMESANQGFEVTPKSELLRALNTYDNFDIAFKSDRLLIDADEIGMYHTQLVLFENKDYKVGFVKTSGESNEKWYSTVTCQNNL